MIAVTFSVGLIPVKNVSNERKNMIANINSIFDLNNKSNSSRLDYIKSSLYMFYKSPIWGIGTGNWFAVYPESNGRIYNDENVVNNSDLNPHNDYLKILSENGLPGFLLYMIIIIYVLVNLIKSSLREIFYLPLLLSFMGVSIFACFSFPFENVSSMIIYFTIIGISINNKNKNTKTDLKFLKIIIISLLLILSITTYYNFKVYKSEKIYLSAMFDKAREDYPDMLSKLKLINLCVYPVDANRVPVEYYEGVGYFEIKDYEKSLEFFNKGIEIAPFWPPLLNNLASAYYMTGEILKADSLLSVVIKNCPDYIEPRINLLVIYANDGKDILARNIITEIQKKEFDNDKVKNYSTFLRIKEYYEKKSN